MQTRRFHGIWVFSRREHGKFLRTVFQAYSKLEAIKYAFHDGIVTLVQAQQYFEDSFSLSDRNNLHSLFAQAYALVNDKVDKYLSEEGQPGLQFLKDVQYFDPKKIVLMSSDLTGVPGWSDVPQTEVDRYRSSLGPAAVENAGLSSLDCSLFWKSCASELPALSRLALRYIFGTVNSADAERSFSLYNLVHSERRRSLGEKSLKQLLFLYFNRFVGRDFFD